MDTTRFDALTKNLANRRSRRSVLRGAGLMAAASAVGLVADVRAQDATRAATEGGEQPEFLFVQTFESGTWAPKEGEDGTFLLALAGHTAQTVYFSDRPERIVGTVPTRDFLDRLGFTPANPPNAALVARTDAGEDIIVLELTEPVLSESFGPDGALTLTYEARVLADYRESGLASFARQATDGSLPATFGEASLFIDDCPDAVVHCFDRGSGRLVDDLGTVHQCYQWSSLCCQPCGDGSQDHYGDLCNQQVPGCNGNCEARMNTSIFFCWQ